MIVLNTFSEKDGWYTGRKRELGFISIILTKACLKHAVRDSSGVAWEETLTDNRGKESGLKNAKRRIC